MRYLLLLILITPLITVADELPELGTSVRALGMGGGYTSVVRDADALFYNPAALARVDGYNWLIFDPRVGVNGTEAIQTAQDVMAAADVNSMLDLLYGKYLWVGGGAKTAFTLPYIGFAAYDNLDASIWVDDRSIPEFHINLVNDYGFALGFAAPILPGLDVGMTVKRIQRTGNRTPFGPADMAQDNMDALMDQVQKKGIGYSLDLGANINVDTPISPTLSFVWKNVGTTKFTAAGTPEAPPSDEGEMILGASLGIDAGLVHVIPVFEYKYLNRSDIQIGKKIHLGVEVGLPLLDLRAGLHQGYYTLGAGMSLGLLRVDAATWGVELGEYPGQREDRRYLVQVSLELGFDPNFNFLGSGDGGSGAGGQSGPRLKRRR